MPKRPYRGLSIASLTLAGVALGLAAMGKGSPASPRPAQDAAIGGPTPGWSTAQSCRICHRADTAKGQPITDFVKLDEVDQWEKNDKHHDAFTVLEGERSKKMQERLGWKTELTSEPRCLSCHAPAGLETAKDPVAIAEGVSCVSCHGAYTEWVAAHGALGNKAKQEAWIDTPAKVKHDTFGMNDLRDPAERTKICASCHVGDSKQNRVVTHEMYAAGHPPLPGLEVSTFSEAEPPHWWSMKQVPYLNLAEGPLIKKYGVTEYQKQIPRFEKLRKQYKVDEFATQHAKLVAVGGIVTFREAMRLYAATAPKDAGSGLPDFARQDCAACHHDLTVWDQSFRQKRGYIADPGRPPVADWPAALVSIAIEAGDPAKKESRTKELEAGLAEYHQAVASIPFGNDQLAAAKAAKLADWSDGLITELDATKFDRATVLRILKQIASIEPPDHASARQLAWSFKTVYEELNPKLPKDSEITTTIAELIKTLDIALTPGQQGTIRREVGARLDADEKFRPETINPLFKKLAELLKE